MLQLSQVIFGVRDLDAATTRFRALGFDVLEGGVHPGVGTANRVIPLGGQYLELLGVVSTEEAAKNAYGRSLLRATADGDRLVRWSLRTDAIDEVAERLAIPVEPRERVRPDGVRITWRAAGLDIALADASMPFFMQWDHAEQYPGAAKARHPNGATGVSFLAITPSDDRSFREWTRGADATLRREPAPEPGIRSVGIATDRGELTLRGGGVADG